MTEPITSECLDLDEVEHLHQEATGEAADADADAKLVDEIVPRLIAELRAARAELNRRAQADAITLVDQTLIRELSVKDGGINLDLIPPHEIALLFVHAAKGMLGDAPNYSETPVAFPREAVSMEVKAAGEYDSYVLTVQRKGKLTPHEARQAAEKRAERAETEAVRLRTELAAPLHFTANGFGAIRDDETGNVTATIDTVRGPVRIDLTEDLAEALGLVLLDDPEHSDGSVQPDGCTCDEADGPCPACQPDADALTGALTDEAHAPGGITNG